MFLCLTRLLIKHSKSPLSTPRDSRDHFPRYCFRGKVLMPKAVRFRVHEGMHPCSTRQSTLRVFFSHSLTRPNSIPCTTKHAPNTREPRNSCRFSLGSTQNISSRGGSEVGTGSQNQAESFVTRTGGAQSTVNNNPETHSQESRRRSDDNPAQRARGVQNGSTLLETRAPHISALGYFVGDARQPVMPAGAALHGRALVGNHHPRPPTSKGSLPSPPALTPGEQPYGVAHPLSPASMGSPPRRHRNSNWGEEGVRLAAEEKENSRQTVPFVVSGTLLG